MKKVTLEITDEIYEQAQKIASDEHTFISKIFVDWITQRIAITNLQTKDVHKWSFWKSDNLDNRDAHIARFWNIDDPVHSDIALKSDLSQRMQEKLSGVVHYSFPFHSRLLSYFFVEREGPILFDSIPEHSDKSDIDLFIDTEALLKHRELKDIENLSDAKIMELANLQMPEDQQETLHELLEKNSEGELTNLEKKYLDEMMNIYNDALLTKSKAMRIAVERGLIESLSSK
jgi:hypothetical protein